LVYITILWQAHLRQVDADGWLLHGLRSHYGIGMRSALLPWVSYAVSCRAHCGMLAKRCGTKDKSMTDLVSIII